MSQVCRRHHREVGIVEFELYATSEESIKGIPKNESSAIVKGTYFRSRCPSIAMPTV